MKIKKRIKRMFKPKRMVFMTTDMKLKTASKLELLTFFASLVFTLFGIATVVYLIIGFQYPYQFDDINNWIFDMMLLNRIKSTPEFRTIVSNITKGCYLEDYCKAERIYRWMVENIDYVNIYRCVAPDETLKNMAGDCCDMAILYCSLAREAGLSCRFGHEPNHEYAIVQIDDDWYRADVAQFVFEKIETGRPGWETLCGID